MPENIFDLFRQSEFGTALIVADQYLEDCKREDGPMHPETLDAMNSLGALLSRVDDHDGAKQMFLKALAGRTKTLGPEHPETLATLGNLGHELKRLGDFQGALRCHRQVLESRERSLPKNHIGIIAGMVDVGSAYNDIDDLGKAEESLSSALATALKELPPGNREITAASLGLAGTLAASGRPESALPILDRAEENLARSQNPDCLETVKVHVARGNALAACGDPAGARDALREALKAASTYFGPKDPRTLGAQMGLGIALGKTGEFAEAMGLLEDAADGFKRALGSRNPHTAVAEGHLENIGSMFFLRMKMIKKILEPGRDAGDVVKDLKKADVPELQIKRILGSLWLDPLQGGPGAPDTSATETPVNLCIDVPRSALRAGPKSPAVQAAKTLFECKERELGPGHEDTLKAQVALGNALLSERRFVSAEKAYGRARVAAEKSLGPLSPAALGSGLCLRIARFLKADSQRKRACFGVQPEPAKP
ncbi:MAG: tetratricopeptide repeat protein [Deltaproteobacteria bacterium]|nr:tetratricopeptide repeat protein [Deltaproteobacteria bacterium]